MPRFDAPFMAEVTLPAGVISSTLIRLLEPVEGRSVGSLPVNGGDEHRLSLTVDHLRFLGNLPIMADGRYDTANMTILLAGGHYFVEFLPEQSATILPMSRRAIRDASEIPSPAAMTNEQMLERAREIKRFSRELERRAQAERDARVANLMHRHTLARFSSITLELSELALTHGVPADLVKLAALAKSTHEAYRQAHEEECQGCPSRPAGPDVEPLGTLITPMLDRHIRETVTGAAGDGDL